MYDDNEEIIFSCPYCDLPSFEGLTTDDWYSMCSSCCCRYEWRMGTDEAE